MFCPNCGTAFPEGHLFCARCGCKRPEPTIDEAPVSIEPAPEATVETIAEETVELTSETAVEPAAEVVAPPIAEVSAEAPAVAAVVPTRKVRKLKYLTSVAPAGIRTAAILVWVFALLSLVLLGVGYFTVQETDVEDLPLMSAALPDLSEMLKKDMEEIAAHLEKHIETEPSLNAKQRKALRRLAHATEDFAEASTLTNLESAFEDFEEVLELELDTEDYGALTTAYNTARALRPLINLVPLILLALVVFCGLWLLFGGLFHLKGLTITGAVLSLLLMLPLYSPALTLAALLLNITTIVLSAVVTAQYKKYRRS